MPARNGSGVPGFSEMIMKQIANRVLGLLLLSLLVFISPAAISQEAEGIVETSRPSGFVETTNWVIDDLMLPFQQAQERVASMERGTGATNDLGKKLGLTEEYMYTGIGAQFLSTILGADVMNAATSWFTGSSVEGQRNPVISETLRFGTYLGVLFTTLFLVAHAVTSFFNKMEYGDFLGESKERFIGSFRAVISFGLVMPVAASGISGATYGVAMAASISNGIGNKAAHVVIEGGFGAGHGSATNVSMVHSYNPDRVGEVFSNGVATETCRQYLRSVGTNAVEVGAICGSITSNDASDLDVEYDPVTATSADDAAYCSSLFERRWHDWMTDNSYVVAACQATLLAQRQARQEAATILEQYDGDLENPEAARQVQDVNRRLHEAAQNEIRRINEEIWNSNYDGRYSNYLHQGMSQLVDAGGWPALGLIYSEIGNQIDAINTLQGVGGSGVGFDYDRLEEAGAHSQSLNRMVSRNGVVTAHGGHAGDGTVIDGAQAPLSWWSPRRWLRGIADGWGAATDYAEDGVRNIVMWVFSPMFEQPGPAATHTIGSTVLGGAMMVVAVHDAAWIAEKIPGIRVAATGAKAMFNSVGSKLSNIKFDGSGSLIAKIIGIYISMMLILLLLVATFLVAILPKMPIFFVAFLALEWAIWCSILIFTAPLWVALNLTVIGNQPGLFSQRALSGLGVLAYLVLFPTLVVLGVVISLIAYNLIIPVLGMLLLLSFGGGGVASIIGIFAMPIVVVLAMSIGGFVAISAITKVPSMITGFLNIQAPGESVTQQATTFVASPLHYSNVTNPGSVMTGSLKQLAKGRAS